MNKYKILIGLIFVVAGITVGSVFVNATSYFQLGLAVILYLSLALFFFVVFPRGTQMTHSGTSAGRQMTPIWPPAGLSKVGTATVKNEESIDVNKRTFLKIIGGAGAAFFLFSIFRNRVDGLFSKGLPAPAADSDKTDLAQNQPMDEYSISEIDDNIIAFYGFTNKEGNWFIMREDTDTGSFRYVKGDLNFPSSWANREKLKYDYYSNVFKL